MNQIKQRILTGWNWVRILYVLMGTIIVIQSVMVNQWMGILFGGYFASMGLFGFGCAGGACYPSYNAPETGERNDPNTSEIKFEEIKEK